MTLAIVLEFNFKESKEYLSPSRVLTVEISGTMSIRKANVVRNLFLKR